MKDEDIELLGYIVAGIAGILDDRGLCSFGEMAEQFGGMALAAEKRKPDTADKLGQIAGMLFRASIGKEEEVRARSLPVN